MSSQAMSGKVVLVTGATSGIGEATARGLAVMGATIAVVGRDESRGKEARMRIATAADSDRVQLLSADLASQQGVRSLAGRSGGASNAWTC